MKKVLSFKAVFLPNKEIFVEIDEDKLHSYKDVCIDAVRKLKLFASDDNHTANVKLYQFIHKKRLEVEERFLGSWAIKLPKLPMEYEEYNEKFTNEIKNLPDSLGIFIRNFIDNNISIQYEYRLDEAKDLIGEIEKHIKK